MVCDKLSFDYDSLTNEEIYEGIDRKYWHNAILSIQNVNMNYVFDMNSFTEVIKKKLEANKMKTNLQSVWIYPVYICSSLKLELEENKIHLSDKEPYMHIRHFLNQLASGCNEVWRYTYEPLIYLGMDIKTIYEE